ncbi:MAG: hypothetical protein IKB82_02725 [Clostridia bacterium]|nr:hypothetical protein [Clostridia bacterium]
MAKNESKPISVLMMGPKRVGKSSVLASMLRSLELMQTQTGVSFEPDETTNTLMRTKLADLRRIYDLHLIGDEFETQSGTAKGEAYAARSEERVSYRFSLSATAEKKRGKTVNEVTEKICDIEFTDIMGEDLNRRQDDIVKRVQESSVIVLAVDSVALMELDEYGGSWNELVNFPLQVRSILTRAYSEAEEHRPQLVLMVPLKCEKYYWQPGGMDRLNARVKESYRELLAFLDNYDDFSIAITPILTLGDVQFSRFDEETGEYSPLYTFRTEDEHGASHTPAYSPRFCSQPLCYIAGFILAMDEYAQRKENEEAKENSSLFKELLKRAFVVFAGGLLGLAVFEMVMLLRKRPEIRLKIEQLTANIKSEGDGYEMLQDGLGILGARDSAQQKAQD